ncbi:unnamed protein product [Dibothriocephalus latus]|uniref:Uncharacterized protein n=1 Tax=Dibothriocephalus latus TaxID=60516 RepID=A0A3P7NTE7_DIBLA|nr:unnamed protein product [Dibothriocephalus latus]
MRQEIGSSDRQQKFRLDKNLLEPSPKSVVESQGPLPIRVDGGVTGGLQRKLRKQEVVTPRRRAKTNLSVSFVDKTEPGGLVG